MAKAKVPVSRFAEIVGTLRKRLTHDLQKELAECALPELPRDASTDLWSLPKVDSKTVAKLSPTVKEITGWRLDPRWIKKGGYATVGQAVEHVIAQIQQHCVAESVTPSSNKALAPTA
jgi:hypothetical protein